jgi:hypothetical protein
MDLSMPVHYAIEIRLAVARREPAGEEREPGLIIPTSIEGRDCH